MQPPPDVRITTAALQAALATASPRGSAVRTGVRALVHAARRAGYPADQLTPLLGETLLPLLRAQHPGAVGDWLWERLVAWARDDYADAAAAEDAPEDAPAAVSVKPAAAAAGAIGASPADAPPVVYRLDGRDVITRVNAAWHAFAAENGAPALAARVVGTSLWAHVDGATTRALYGRVHAAVRRSGRPVTLPFRCDAPGERRWMALTVRPLGGGHLQVVSTLTRRARWPRVALLDPAVARGAGQLLMCSWCKRVRVDGSDSAAGATADDGATRDADGMRRWVDIDDLPAEPPPAGVPRVVHDACPDCAADVRAALASA